MFEINGWQLRINDKAESRLLQGDMSGRRCLLEVSFLQQHPTDLKKLMSLCIQLETHFDLDSAQQNMVTDWIRSQII